jgi:hypothetical protein
MNTMHLMETEPKGLGGHQMDWLFDCLQEAATVC